MNNFDTMLKSHPKPWTPFWRKPGLGMLSFSTGDDKRTRWKIVDANHQVVAENLDADIARGIAAAVNLHSA